MSKRRIVLLLFVAIFLLIIFTIISVLDKKNATYLSGAFTISKPIHSSNGLCLSPYGKTAIFIAVKFDPKVGNAPLYNVAQTTVECYAKRAGYELIFVNLKDDNVTGNACDRFSINTFHFRRHCHLSQYMAARQDIKWWLFMDADVMIVNPNRCIHEFIDPDVHITTYERFWNLEIATGGMIYKNSNISRKFLLDLAEYELKVPRTPNLKWTGHDNGAVHLVAPELVFSNGSKSSEIEHCRLMWGNSTTMDLYYEFTRCGRTILGSSRQWGNKLRLLHRGHGWTMDLFITNWEVSDAHFMTHNVKASNLTGQRVFDSLPSGNQCESNGPEWNYIPGKWVNMTHMQHKMETVDNAYINGIVKKDINNSTMPFRYRIGKCWPNCPMIFEHNVL